MSKATVALLLAALLSTLPSCLFGARSKVSYTGRHVSQATMDEVPKGASKAFVLELFGEPSSTTDLDDGAELWAWRYTKETKNSGSVFLILGTSSERTEQGSVYVRFKDGKVEKVWSKES